MPAGTYTHTTFSQAKAQLAARLQDSSNVHWTDTGTYSELGLYIKEALRTWSALTGYWRTRGTFTTTSATAFYDIPAKIPTLRGYTLKDQDLVADMQFHLLEPATGNSWTGTEQFVLSDLTNALQRRRDQFLSETGCVVTRSTQASGFPDFTNNLPDTVIDVRRAAFQDSANTYFNLEREDEWTLANFLPTWDTVAAQPICYSISIAPPVTLITAPIPSAAGTLEILSVQTGTALDPATGVLLNIPDDFAWIVKWGALADLLSKDGIAKDPMRAAYCEQRYKHGVELATLAPAIINAEITQPLAAAPLADLDRYNFNWENVTGKPTEIAVAGLNLIALSPVPDGVYTVTLDLVQNAVVPSVGGDQLQIGREDLECILGYAEHLALFKEGDVDFQASTRYWDNLINVAGDHNNSIAAQIRFVVPTADQSSRENIIRPVGIPAMGFTSLPPRQEKPD